jgi:predicted membrane-bound spermidine synthase
MGLRMKYRFTNLSIQVALALSAASALIYEVVATNILFFYFIRSSYSVATVLSVFLLGLGIGSLLIYFLLDRIRNKRLLFGVLQILIALYSFFILTNLTEIVPKISTLGTFTAGFAVLLVPTIFLGAVFPLAGSIFKRDKRDIIGIVYSSDLFGAIVGSMAAGFLLIPFYGNTTTIIFGAVLNVLSAFIILSKRQKTLPFLLIAAFAAIPTISGGVVYEDMNNYQFHSPSPYGLVKVINGTLYIDEREQCSLSYPHNTSERMMAVHALNPLEKKGRLDVLDIGLGCGLTLEKVLEYDTNVDVVEINSQVVLANKGMTNVLTNPRVNLILDDGLNYMRYSKKRYDCVLIDVQNPSVVHSSNMYTVEAFKIVSDSLTDEGTFALWSFDISDERFLDILYYSLKEAFPFVYKHPGVFLSSKKKLNEAEYKPTGPYEINTINRNVLSQAVFG